MANDDLSEEIQLLRKQLEEIQKQQEASASDAVSEENAEPSGLIHEAELTENSEPTGREDMGEVGQKLVGQFRELLDSIDKDIKDTKPSTLLIVFALGVLVGRL